MLAPHCILASDCSLCWLLVVAGPMRSFPSKTSARSRAPRTLSMHAMFSVAFHALSTFTARPKCWHHHATVPGDSRRDPAKLGLERPEALLHLCVATGACTRSVTCRMALASRPATCLARIQGTHATRGPCACPVSSTVTAVQRPWVLLSTSWAVRHAQSQPCRGI